MQFSMQSVLGMVLICTIATMSGVSCQLSCPDATYGCFTGPPGCTAADCEVLTAWKANDANGIDFIIGAKLTTTTRWAAVGFSKDTKMGDDDILMCTTENDLRHYWSVVQTIVPKNSATQLEDGLTNVEVMSADGYLHCNFTRAVSVAGKDEIYDLGATTGPDMTSIYYFFFGTGPLTSGEPVEHEHDPFYSSEPVDYMTAGNIMGNASDSSSSSEESDSHEDGVENMTASAMLVMMISCIVMLFK